MTNINSLYRLKEYIRIMYHVLLIEFSKYSDNISKQFSAVRIWLNIFLAELKEVEV